MGSLFDKAGGSYITTEEKAVLAKEHTPFRVTAVSIEDGYQPGSKAYVLDIVLEDGPEPEERKLGGLTIGKKKPDGTYDGVESRDQGIERLIAHFEGGGDPVYLYLTKAGRAFLLQEVEEG